MTNVRGILVKAVYHIQLSACSTDQTQQIEKLYVILSSANLSKNIFEELLNAIIDRVM